MYWGHGVKFGLILVCNVKHAHISNNDNKVDQNGKTDNVMYLTWSHSCGL